MACRTWGLPVTSGGHVMWPSSAVTSSSELRNRERDRPGARPSSGPRCGNLAVGRDERLALLVAGGAPDDSQARVAYVPTAGVGRDWETTRRARRVVSGAPGSRRWLAPRAWAASAELVHDVELFVLEKGGGPSCSSTRSVPPTDVTSSRAPVRVQDDIDAAIGAVPVCVQRPVDVNVIINWLVVPPTLAGLSALSTGWRRFLACRGGRADVDDVAAAGGGAGPRGRAAVAAGVRHVASLRGAITRTSPT